MAQFLYDFEWQRDPTGQEFSLVAEDKRLHASIDRASPGESINRSATQIALTLCKSQRIIRTSHTSLQTYHPIDTYPGLYKQFAKIENPVELLGFIKSYGPLTENGFNAETGDNVETLLKHAKQMRDLLHTYASGRKEDLPMMLGPKGVRLGDDRPIGEVQVKPIFDPATKSLQLQLTPRYLLNAIWLMLVQRLSGIPNLRSCRHCGDIFEVGAGTGRRADALYCSDAHQVEFNSRHRKPAKNGR